MSDRNSASRSPRIVYSITILALLAAATVAQPPQPPHEREGKRAVATARPGDPATTSASARPVAASSRTRIAPPQYVDWRDDEWTHRRQQGVRPAQVISATIGTVAGGGCSFDIECDDGNPCTLDQCDIEAGEPLGSGGCTNSNLLPGSPGECDDGIFCNGTETCEGETPVCTSSGSPCAGGEVCSELLETCHPPCATDEDCDNTIRCDGVETCDSGTCQSGSPPCGAAASCQERYCFGPGCHPGCHFKPCETIDDCPAGQCVDGPLCFDGRCCAHAGGGQFDCVPYTELECDDLGAGWYATDSGRWTFGEDVCTAELGCPVYSGGIMDQDVTSVLGPASLSPLPAAPFGQTAVRIGDDYTTSRGSFIAMTEFRFLGAAIDLPERAVRFEWLDSAGNLVEDFVVEVESAQSVQPVLLDPPLVIPASGFVVASVATNLTPNAKLFWAATDLPEIGTNNANMLWLDAVRDDVDPSVGGIVGNFGTSGALAFEIVGDDVPAPNGACCDFDMGTCDDVPSWTCAELGGNFAGAGDLCASCSPESMTAAAPCRTCSDTSDPCLSNDDCAGTCEPNDDLCRFCSEGSSENEFLPCNIDADCGDGTCAGTCTPSNACITGACCATDGSCDMTTLNDCTGTFYGLGSTCDPNCCAQPTPSGSDDCEAVTPHVISVPESTEPPVVVTITGDNSSASSLAASPDSCFPPSGDPLTQELGWFEAFTIDDCAFVTIDFCCTSPAKQPAYPFIFADCPCGFPLHSWSNEFDPLAPSGTGAPFCAGDNPWHRFGPLEAGTYYYPVFSQLAGSFGPYQLHIEVSGCPDARCCLIDEQDEPVCTLLNQLECAAAGGYYQGPPNMIELIDTCTPDACDTGSCCLGPGDCQDDNGVGGDMTASLCIDTLRGTYIGGAPCYGGTCSTSTNISCFLDEDCPGGTQSCLITEQQELERPACPLCEIESFANCQRFENRRDGWVVSERRANGLGSYAAEDFMPDASTISSVCVWGTYLDDDPDGDLNCGDEVIDRFRVRVFESDGAGGVLPGTLVGESMVVSTRSIVPYYSWLIEPDVWAFQLELIDPIAGLLTDGTVYWLEVTNESVPYYGDPATEKCHWYWETISSTTNAFSAVGSEAGYPDTGARPRDFAFCLGGRDGPVPIAPVGGFTNAELERACCTCEPDCRLRTLAECADLTGSWNLLDNSPTCDSTTCDGSPPTGDDCLTSAIEVQTDNAIIPFDATCATRDGSETVVDEFLGETPVESDLWFFYRPSRDGVLEVRLCEPFSSFDSVIAIYHDPLNPEICPCPIDATSDLATRFTDEYGRYGAEENCTGFINGGGGFLLREVEAGLCYTIRAGEVPRPDPPQSLLGAVEFIHRQPAPPAPPNPNPAGPAFARVCDDATGQTHGEHCTVCSGGSRDGLPCYASGSADCPSGTCTASDALCGDGTCSRQAPYPSARFATVEVPPDNPELDPNRAVRIRVIDIPGAPALTGETRFLGPPADFFEGDQFTPQFGTFRAATLQCEPYFTDWSAEGVVSACGQLLVPGAAYEVQQLRESCDASAQDESCFSAPLRVTTAAMGDVVAPFEGSTHLNQPDISDILAIVDKFLGSPAAVGKYRTMQAPAVLDLSQKVDIASILAAVDSFLGAAYDAADLPLPGTCP